MVLTGRAIRPGDGNALNRLGGAETEMERNIGGGHEAAAPANDGDLGTPAGLKLHAGPDGFEVGMAADQTQADRVGRAVAFIDQNAHRSVNRGHNQVEITVSVEVAHRNAPTRSERVK